MAPSDAGGLDAVQNRTLPHYTEWCIEVRPYCLTIGIDFPFYFLVSIQMKTLSSVLSVTTPPFAIATA